MTLPAGPSLDARRTEEFLAELRERARAWIPTWDVGDEAQRDFGSALLEIAARFSSEVAERFDRGAAKMQRGFFDWLAVRGKAAQPARMPVVLKLADTATDGILAEKPVRLQADAGGAVVTFETETDVRVVPGRVDVIVGVDADNDAYYLPWPGLTDLKPFEPLPTQWLAKGFAAVGAIKIQLDPDLGLDAGLLLDIAGRQYRVTNVDKDLVTLVPKLETELAEGTQVTKVASFAPFDGQARNWQSHALYFGDEELLNIESEAAIEIIGSQRLKSGFIWQYLGKTETSDEDDWRPLPLDPNRQDAIVLKKPKGEIAQHDIDGKSGRWIRAYAQTIGASDEPLRAEEFAIRINASQCGSGPTVCPPTTVVASPAAEAMANTTPLVLDNVFLPLGREPRQFDAFYLGSPEAFSKKGAQVRICFELADPTFASLAVVREGLLANMVIAGVGKDRALHVFFLNPFTQAMTRYAGRDALRPPLPGDGGAAPAQTTQVSLNPQCRPVITTVASDFFIQVAAGGSIWTWHENIFGPTLSGWAEFDRLPEADPPHRIDDIVPVSQANTRVVLSKCELWVHDGISWDRKTTTDPNPNPAVPVTLAALVPVLLNSSGALVPSAAMVGVSDDNLLYSITINGACDPLPLHFGPGDDELVHAGDGTAGTCKTGGIRPAAYSEVGGLLAVVTANDTRDRLVAYVDRPALGTTEVLRIDLPPNEVVAGSTVDISFVNSSPQFSVLCRRQDDSTYIASWQPLDPDPTLRTILFSSATPESGRLNGAPVTLTSHVVAPGTRGDLLVAPFDPLQRRLLTTGAAEDGAVLPKTNPLFAVNDEFSVFDANSDRILRAVAALGLNIPPDSEVLYPVAATFGPVSNDLDLLAYRRSALQFTGVIIDADNITLDNADSETIVGTVLVIEVAGNADLYMVIDDTNYPDVTIAPSLSAAAGNADYWTPAALAGRVAPIIRLDAVTGNWDASLVPRSQLYFPTAQPQVQRAKAFEIAANQPRTLALSTPWTIAPAPGDLYIIDSTIGQWEQVLSDTSSNPELSWEYSNGTAWGSLALEEEGTLNLKNTGAIRFTVPDDLAATDWAGKTSHWIRARLIGGDYGREKVTVKTKDLGNNQTEQTVERSTEGIRPPAVVALHISYGFCGGITPKFVLTEDSGSTRDQSDANRTSGAIVEAFVPLSVTLGRLLHGPAAETAAHDCPPGCSCHSQQATTSGTAVSTSPSSTPRVSGRSLFVGLTREPSGEPVNTLFLVDVERDHNRFAPLNMLAHVADRLVPVVVDDATRGLGESGLIKAAFTVQPTLRELFGRTLAWLQLTPSRGASTEWVPALRGAYLNGVWASATETLTRELLGSSDGRPNLTVTLARPPLLEGTLELRVQEPLGEEERRQLRDAYGDAIVLSDVDGLPGDWVLWNQVIDPGDEPPDARVYALDETTGTIRFGDGLHGKIPPIGTDSIVAFSYQRTEPGPPGSLSVPGNAIAPRTSLNLVTPIVGAESAIAADQSAGGAPPESTDRILRFGLARLRHRERAVSAHDVEDLALQSSPDIVQARAIFRRWYLRLVIVTRARKPIPNAAQIRELRRTLLAVAPASLSAPNALRIGGPTIRRLRVELTVRVESLDYAGAVSRDAKRRLLALFDTATGGTQKEGWALGMSPRVEDIAYALIDAPFLESLIDVELHEIGADGSERPWPASLKPMELAVLDDDLMRIHFESAEAAA